MITLALDVLIDPWCAIFPAANIFCHLASSLLPHIQIRLPIHSQLVSSCWMLTPWWVVRLVPLKAHLASNSVVRDCLEMQLSVIPQRLKLPSCKHHAPKQTCWELRQQTKCQLYCTRGINHMFIWDYIWEIFKQRLYLWVEKDLSLNLVN